MSASARLRSILLLATLAQGCAHGRSAYPTAQTDLALQRVVLYRNGIGYFERHGEVEGDALAIKVRKDQVDDLLKSLTVIDRSTGKAVSVSMPLDPESWASAALSTLAPGRGSLAEVLDGLRGTDVVLRTLEGRIHGRIVMVERIVNEPDPTARAMRSGMPTAEGPQQDHRVTLLAGDTMQTVRLSKIFGVVLRDGDLALQLNRRLDASAGEGMFQQVEVVVRLAGKRAHDLAVSYVVAAPMWKPTYRVVLPPQGKGKALLQGWAVVDNTSGEDWNDVMLSLTSGEPIAFRYDLHTPRTLERADLTEAGVARRAQVAVGETAPRGDGHRRQLLAARDIADGMDVLDIRALEHVRHDVPRGIHCHAGPGEIQVFRVRAASDRPDDAVERSELSAVFQIEDQAGTVAPDPGGHGVVEQRHAVRAHFIHQRRGQHCIEVPQHALVAERQRGLAAQCREHTRELHRDVAAAHDEDAAGLRGQREEAVGVDAEFRARDRGPHRLPTRGDHHVRALDALALHDHGVR
jgi:hypothetical protein